MVVIRKDLARSMSPFTNTKNVDAAESPVIRASTHYMETIQQMMPISGGNDIHAFLNANNDLDLYSVGTGRAIFRLRPATDEYGPYEVTDLGVSASQLALYNVTGHDPNNPNILGLNGEGKMTLSVYNAGAYQQQVFEPTGATETIREFLAVQGPTGNVYANVMLDDGTSSDDFLLGNNFFTPGEENWASQRWAPIKGPDGSDARVKGIAMCENAPTQSALFAIGNNQQVWFNEDNFAVNQMRDLGYLKITDLSVVADQDNLLNIFAVEEGSGLLWVKKQKKYSADGQIQFEDWQQIGGNKPLTRIYATMRFDQMLEVYAIGTDGILYQNNQFEQNRKMVWSELFPLGNQVDNSTFAVTQNANGYSEVFTVTNENDILHFWRDPETTQWFSERIKAENPETVAVSIPTHSLIITVLDNNGVPQPNLEIEMATSFLTSLNINGLAYQSSALRKIHPTTDLSGNLNIFMEATSLSAASILIETKYTTLGQPIQVEPNAQLQHKIYNTTWEEVYNAQDASGNYLLGEDRTEENAKSMASIMNASMSLGMGENAAPVQYFVPSRGRKLGWSAKMDISRVQQQHWEIDFTSGFPVYKDLNNAVEAANRIAGLRANASPVSLGLWDDFTDFWGNFWQGIKEGVSSLIEGIQNIIITVTDKIKVVFHMIIDGVTQVVETVIDYVQQAFDFVEGVWNWLKVKLEQLYQWLAFLFQWEDIKRTASAIEYSTNVFLDFVVSALEYAKEGVSDWIDQIKADLDSAVNTYLAELNNQDQLGNIGEEYEQPVPEQENAAEHNPLYNPFKANYKGTSITRAAYAEAAFDEGPIMELVDKLKALADNFEFGDGKHAFDEALGYFGDITSAEGVDEALKLLLSGLIKVLESVALFGLDFAKGVILSIFDIIRDLVLAFKDIMNEEWTIPIVSAVYEFITGDKLSFRPMQLLSYFVAIPTTVIYKIKEGEAPFPDESSLLAFKAKYNVEYLKQRAGITSSDRFALDTAEVDSTVKVLFQCGYAITLFVQSFADIGTAISSSAGTENSVLGYVSLGCALFGGVFTNPWIVEEGPGKLCQGSDETSISWLATVVTVFRGVAMYYAKKKNKVSGETAVRVDELTKSVAGGINTVIYIVDYVGFQKQKKPYVFARNLCTTIPGNFLRFLSIKEVNEGAYFIPVGVLSVLIFSGYTSAFIVNFYAE